MRFAMNTFLAIIQKVYIVFRTDLYVPHLVAPAHEGRFSQHPRNGREIPNPRCGSRERERIMIYDFLYDRNIIIRARS